MLHSLVTADKNWTMLISRCAHDVQCAVALFDHAIHSFELTNYSILSLGYCAHAELGRVRKQLALARCHHPVLCFETI